MFPIDPLDLAERVSFRVKQRRRMTALCLCTALHALAERSPYLHQDRKEKDSRRPQWTSLPKAWEHGVDMDFLAEQCYTDDSYVVFFRISRISCWKVVEMMFRSFAKRLLCAAAALLLTLTMGFASAEGQIVPLPVDDSPGPAVNESYYQSDVLYEDPSLRVAIEQYMWENSKVFVARITIAHPSQLRSASAYGFNRKQVASVLDMANRNNAVVAINGDYCYYQLSTVGSYLVRQGKVYAERMAKGRDMLLIDDKGDFTIVQDCSHEKLAEYSDINIVNSFSFGPGLVVNGQPLAENYYAKFNGSRHRHQRAAIAQVEKGRLEYVCAVSEGDKESKDGGLTLHEWSAFLMTLGVENAYNLDGGNSTGLIFQNQKINAVTNPQHRKLSDIIYFATAYQE